MAVTKADNQHFKLKKKIKNIYEISQDCWNGDKPCAIKDVLAPSVDKWSLFCLYNLAYNKVLRFNKLKKYTPGISSRMLSVTLKKLEAAQLIRRQLYAEVPPKVEYSLTEFGYEFAQKLVDLNLWIYQKRLPNNK